MSIGKAAFVAAQDAKRLSRRPTAHAPLAIPTPDEDPNVGHPSVVHIPDGFAGIPWWMAFTPYPPGARENPCVVASYNGVEWFVPPGCPFPIATYQDALDSGHAHWSDTHLVHDAVANRLMLYFRGAGGAGEDEAVWLTTSTNGRDWSEPQKVISMGEPGDKILSPAVVQEADGTFSMWSVNFGEPPDDRLERRTSSDGVTWSAPTTCTMSGPFDYGIWHVDVQRLAEGGYAALFTSSSRYRVQYAESSDGLAWRYYPPIPLTGAAFDNAYHYRSALVPNPDRPGAFDVYLTGIDDSNEDPFAAEWRIGLVRGTDLKKPVALLNDDHVLAEDQRPRGGLRLDGTSGNYASTPDHSDLDITGDLDLRALIKTDQWLPANPMCIVGKYRGSDNQRSYMFTINNNGTLRLLWSEDGANAKSENSNVIPFDGEEKLWVRVTLDVDNGDGAYEVRFWTSRNGRGWTQFGPTRTGASPTSLFVGTAPLTIGASETDGASNRFIGTIYEAVVMDGIGDDGEIVANPVFAGYPGAWTMNGMTAFDGHRVWTIHGTRWEWRE